MTMLLGLEQKQFRFTDVSGGAEKLSNIRNWVNECCRSCDLLIG